MTRIKALSHDNGVVILPLDPTSSSRDFEGEAYLRFIRKWICRGTLRQHHAE